MMQFLPPISATTRLRCSWPGAGSAARRRISIPTAPRAGEGDRVDAGMPRPGRRRRRPRPGSRLSARREPGALQRVDRAPARSRATARRASGRRRCRWRARRRSSRWRSRAGSSRGRSPRRRRAAVVKRVALAGQLDQRRPPSSSTACERVVLEEVDRLADVGVRLGPGLGALAHLERRQLVAALRSSPAARAQDRGALGGETAAAQSPGRVAGRRDGILDLGRARRAAAAATTRSGSPGSIEIE